MRRLIVSIITAVAMAAGANQWDAVKLKGSTDKEPCSYRTGEKMRFTFTLEGLADGASIEGCQLKWKRRGDDGREEKGLMPLSPGGMCIETAIDRPGFVHVEAWVVDAGGEKVKREKKSGKTCIGDADVYFGGGAGADLRAIRQGVPEPKDFDARWRKTLARLRAERPVDAKNLAKYMKDVGAGLGFECYEVEVPSFGPGWGESFATGYLTVPKGAKPGSLKAKVSFDGYGIYKQGRPGWCDPGTMELHVNAHGIRPLTLDGEAFEAFKRDVIESRGQYAFNEDDNGSFEKAYFFGMAMRVVSATTFMREFAKSRPEWDGKTLIVTGGSQGGLQACWAAAFVKGVSELKIHVPWCCDLGGTEVGRMGGWRPKRTEALGYYDPVNVAKRMPANQKKDIFRSALGDYIAPPCSHAVLYNSMKGRRHIKFTQGGDHSADPD